jgi:exodeoxyribonuclease VII small subunit
MADGKAEGRPGERPGERPVAEMAFEEALAELESVVTRLERGDVALDESIALYERGAQLRRRCEQKLREAEEKVQKITLTDGQPTGAQPFDAG